MFELITTTRCFKDLSIFLTSESNTHEEKFLSVEQYHCEHHQRNFLQLSFWFFTTSRKEKSGLVYKLTLKRHNDNSMFSQNAGTVDGKVDKKSIGWYNPLYTPFVIPQIFLSQQIIRKMPNKTS